MSRSFLTEQELALGCARNERDAQGELYARYAAGLYALSLRYIENREEARDLMHDAMIKAMDNFKSFKYAGEGSIWAWLSRITVNMAVDRLRKSLLNSPERKRLVQLKDKMKTQKALII